MRSTFVALGAIVIVVAVLVTGYLAPHADASTGPIPLNCNRACLENLVDQYLAAVVAHDPKRLPLSADVKYTENDQLIEVGDGFWKTVQGRGNYTHIWADPEFGQVAYMGTMREAGQPLLLSLRLRVQLGRITEIESVYFRSGSGGPNNIAGMDAPHKPEDMWFKSIPPAQQMSRQELIAVADGYFTGLQHNDGKGINGTGTYPFTGDCSRIENGSLTAKAPPRNPPPADGIDALPWTVWGSSSSATISWCRTFTIAGIRWSTANAAWCGRTWCSIKARSTKASSPTDGRTSSRASTGRRVSW